MESGERSGIGVAHSVEAPGGGKQQETRTKEARVTVVRLKDAGEASECGECQILTVYSNSVAASVNDPKQRPRKLVVERGVISLLLRRGRGGEGLG